jgi:hypothetical protein|tara:strand:+ start:1832 stop:2209 length:378 start_codon:yes stop_codon:yes gene_type:complete
VHDFRNRKEYKYILDDNVYKNASEIEGMAELLEMTLFGTTVVTHIGTIAAGAAQAGVEESGLGIEPSYVIPAVLANAGITSISAGVIAPENKFKSGITGLAVGGLLGTAEFYLGYFITKGAYMLG